MRRTGAGLIAQVTAPGISPAIRSPLRGPHAAKCVSAIATRAVRPAHTPALTANRKRARPLLPVSHLKNNVQQPPFVLEQADDPVRRGVAGSAEGGGYPDRSQAADRVNIASGFAGARQRVTRYSPHSVADQNQPLPDGASRRRSRCSWPGRRLAPPTGSSNDWTYFPLRSRLCNGMPNRLRSGTVAATTSRSPAAKTASKTWTWTGALRTNARSGPTTDSRRLRASKM